MKIYPKSNRYNIDAIFFKLSDEEILPLKEEASIIETKIKSDCKSLKEIEYNRKLAGQLEHQYALSEKSEIHLENILRPAVKQYIEKYQRDIFSSTDNICLVNKTKKEKQCWINFQKKYEYNPIHTHSGFLSFVIWLKVPYSLQDEMNQPNSIKAKNEFLMVNGDFCFIKIDNFNFINHPIDRIQLGVDRSWETRGVLFHAAVPHTVHPFYTSDEYRISISGNYIIK